MIPAGLITELKKFATHDGPGIRTTVFLKGCPLKCRWCSNPETIDIRPQIYFVAKRCKACGACEAVCPEGAISMDKDDRIDRSRCTLCMQCVEECPYRALRQVGHAWTLDEVLEEIVKDKPFYGNDGGVTLSGGEPLFQKDFALPLLRRCSEEGLSTVIDTTGYASPATVEEAMRYTDMVLLDIKHMDSVKHREGTGVDNTLILENARRMSSMTMVRISLPLIPDYNDDQLNLTATANFALSIGVDHIDLNPLHLLGTDKYRCLGLKSPYGQFRELSREEVLEAKGCLEKDGLQVTIGRMM